MSDTSSDAVRQANINIKYTEDDCYISGMATLAPDMLLVADSACSSVKIINTRNNTIVSYLKLYSGPRDITVVSDVSAAVTVPEKHLIQMFSTSSYKLAMDREIDVMDECYGLDFDTERQLFVVSFVTPPKIEMINFDGDRVWCIENNFEVDPRPLYVRFCNDGYNIYVSDVNTNSVTLLSEDKKIVFKYSSPEMKKPRGIVVLSDNRFLVCGWHSNNVHLVSECGEYIRTIISEKDGLIFPCAIAYSETDRKLFVSAKLIMAGSDIWDNIKVYQVDT